MIKKSIKKARFRIKENIDIQVIGADGKIKKTFQPNKLFNYLMAIGIVSPHFYKIPLLLGHWADKATISNLLPTVGKALVAGRIMGSGSPAASTYIGVGTGTTAANATDTGLETETTVSGLTRATATISLVTTDVTDDTAQAVKSFAVTGTVAVTEAGMLNAGFGGGTLLARQKFSAVNVINGDTLEITWKFDVD